MEDRENRLGRGSPANPPTAPSRKFTSAHTTLGRTDKRWPFGVIVTPQGQSRRPDRE